MTATLRFGIVALLAEAGFFACLLVLPLHTQELGMNRTDTGLVLAAYSLASLLCAPVWGRATDRRGRRRTVVAAGFAVYAVASLMLPWADGLGALVVLRLLQGAGFAVMPVLTALYGDALGARAGRGFGLYSGAAALGLALGSIGGGTVAEIAGMDAVFLLSGALGLASVALVRLGLPPEPSQRPRRGAAPAGPRHAAVYGTVLIRHGAAMGVWSIFAVLLRERFADLGTIGWLVGVNLLAQPVFRILLVRAVADRPRRRQRMLLGSVIGSALGFAGLAVATEVGQLVVLQIVIAATCAGVLTGASLHLLERTTADERGAEFGYLQASFHTAGIVGPLLAGLSVDRIGLAPTIVVLAAASLLALLPAASLHRAPGPEPTRPASAGVAEWGRRGAPSEVRDPVLEEALPSSATRRAPSS